MVAVVYRFEAETVSRTILLIESIRVTDPVGCEVVPKRELVIMATIKPIQKYNEMQDTRKRFATVARSKAS